MILLQRKRYHQTILKAMEALKKVGRSISNIVLKQYLLILPLESITNVLLVGKAITFVKDF